MKSGVPDEQAGADRKQKQRGKPFTRETGQPSDVNVDGSTQDLLSAMRWVATHRKAAGEPEMLKDLRVWKAKNPQAFYSRMAELQVAETKAIPEPEEEAAEPKTQMLLDLMDRMMLEANVYAKVGTCVTDAWPHLTAAEQETIVAVVDTGLARSPTASKCEKLSDRLKYSGPTPSEASGW
jgi:hypothetical protein